MSTRDRTTDARAVMHVRHGNASFPFEVALHHRLPHADAMQRRAQQTGLETAFLASAAPSDTSPGEPAHFQARWFSPHGEMQLCGAGALAAALFLFRGHVEPTREVVFDTAAGRLRARSKGRRRVAVRLPRYMLQPHTPSAALTRTLGLNAPPPPAFVSAEAQTVVFVLPERSQVAALRPDFGALKAVREPNLGAVIVTGRGDPFCDFVFRYFTPWHGKDESAVAGSALSLLAPYWADRLGASALRAHQRAQQEARFSARVERAGVWLAGSGGNASAD